MRDLDIRDITEHSYHDGTVSSARCALWGNFPEEETEKSGLKTFNFIFSPRPETDTGAYLPQFENYDILHISVTENDSGYEFTVDCSKYVNGETDFRHLHFTCEKISACLCTFDDFSYKNIYDESTYPEAKEYLDEKYFICTDEYDIGDGITVRYEIYGEESESKNKYVGARIAKCTYFQNGEKIFEHLTDRHHLHPFKSVINHSNGHSYIPFHVDLYGISFFEIETGKRYDYIPEGQEHDISFDGGESFIVCDIFYDSESNLLACDGCYWACPNEIFVMDLSDPMQYDPRMVRMHGEIPMDYYEYDDIDFVRWEEGSLILKGEDGNEYTVTKARLREMLAEKSRSFPLEDLDN